VRGKDPAHEGQTTCFLYWLESVLLLELLGVAHLGPGPPGLEAPEKKIPLLPLFGKLTQNFFPVRLLAAAAAGGRTANGR
jgi:hypothetical protein